MPDVDAESSARARDEIVARLRGFFAAQGTNVVAAYLFGSTARGRARPTSDVDVAVLLATTPPLTLESIPVELESELTRVLGTATDVVILNRAPVDLVKRVLRDGILVAERDRSRRIAFEVHARNALLGPLAGPEALPGTSGAPLVTDADLVAKRLALIETLVRELRTLARPERIRDDVREERFVEHTLQLAIQAVLDVASHIVSDDRLGEPVTLQDLFAILARHGRLDAQLVPTLSRAAGFRNVLVHGYTAVDLDVVRDVVDNHLDDLLAFVAAVRKHS